MSEKQPFNNTIDEKKKKKKKTKVRVESEEVKKVRISEIKSKFHKGKS